jgi:hypothetical protein
MLRQFWLLVAYFIPTEDAKRWALHRWADTLPEEIRYLGHLKAAFAELGDQPPRYECGGDSDLCVNCSYAAISHDLIKGGQLLCPPR